MKFSVLLRSLIIFLAASATSSTAQIFKTLASFDGTNGMLPSAPLAQGLDGHLYGTTYYGGTLGDGAVFVISEKADITLLYAFCALEDCADGSEPSAELVLSAGGDFYGTARYGGAYQGGTVFKITPQGQETTLYTFCVQSNCIDGEYPKAGLVQAANGDFYGTTQSGGTNAFCGDPPAACGTVFKMTLGGTLTTLYNFCSLTNCADGGSPQGGLIQGTNGDFYGATVVGGAHSYGTVFRITPAGKLATLYSFCAQLGCTDGAYPVAALVQAIDGDFYGTTNEGGNLSCNAPYGCGTVFKITPSGVFTTLYTFGSQSGDGMFPYAGLIQATDGNFYGTTYRGGARGEGTLFEITSGGKLTTLYSFCPDFYCDDGAYPVAALVQATNGTLYGTAETGGTPNDGSVFSLDMGLSPFVAFVRPYGKAGQTGGILGQGFTGTTGVSLNGTPASFRVVSDTFIKATVPAGATTGYVTVTTPSGTLTSNVLFRVLP